MTVYEILSTYRPLDLQLAPAPMPILSPALHEPCLVANTPREIPSPNGCPP